LKDGNFRKDSLAGSKVFNDPELRPVLTAGRSLTIRPAPGKNWSGEKAALVSAGCHTRPGRSSDLTPRSDTGKSLNFGR